MPRSREIFTFGFRGFPGVQGGIESHVSELAPRLVADGHDVTACFRTPYVDGKCGREWNGVRLCKLWTLRNSNLETIIHSVVCAIVAGFRRPALVHIHGIGPALVTPLVRLFGLPVVVTHHGADYDREKWGRMARLVLRCGEAAGMRFANRRIVLSRNIEGKIRNKYGKACEVIPNGVLVPELPVRTDRVDALGLEPGRYILMVGRLVPEKRQLDAIRAFAAARPSGWKLVIVGQTDHVSDYAQSLAREAATNPDVVMAGLRTGEDLHQLYAHAGLFVLPSSHEGLPIALLEALSYGVPVLVSDIAANREVIDDPERIFQMGNVAELAARFTAFAGATPKILDREPSRRDCARRFDWDAIARRTAAVYAEALRQPVTLTPRPRGVERRA
ncbi:MULTISPECIES: glycosyltransferase family 4 protein [Rhodopseudomonas]|uniref:glycosyltransferase family 4 protein n=1 Tax=Rhodopseudomonas TaxID=1073 RepID=UPI0009BB7C8F|nr:MULTISPECIES: glycosyltransferase family 4 protein [Rhodopseudomonas]MDF3812600.1 glycosyltransferase family 4 protein [Rhodopseudomonas sp. BAL398]WOK17703.1 glycosyltransferase family 4 protein [Rhodopseudomonas sp. BAL398]